MPYMDGMGSSWPKILLTYDSCAVANPMIIWDAFGDSRMPVMTRMTLCLYGVHHENLVTWENQA